MKGQKYLIYGLVAVGLTGVVMMIVFRSKVRSMSAKYLAPVSGSLRSSFGMRIHPVTNQKAMHNGIDLAVPKGTPVKSPQDAQVIAAAYDELNGNYVKLKHSDGWITSYAHLDSFSVKPGDSIKRGEVFAKVGTTGRSTGAHLHLAVRNSAGEFVDPMKTKFKPELFA